MFKKIWWFVSDIVWCVLFFVGFFPDDGVERDTVEKKT